MTQQLVACFSAGVFIAMIFTIFATIVVPGSI